MIVTVVTLLSVGVPVHGMPPVVCSDAWEDIVEK